MWFVVRVQTGREEQVNKMLAERAGAAGMDGKILEVLVPTERISEIKGGNKQIRERKIYPGYILMNIEVAEGEEIAEDVWYFIRSIPCLGDFVGPGRKPVPMAQHEIDRVLAEVRSQEEKPKIPVPFKKGDGVRINEGPFENFDGNVVDVNPEKGLVKVVINIFGRSTPVELEYWQVEPV